MPASDFENPAKECDLVMKGGITSGVVYPFTIRELARDHRLVNIGGTSAGAIAAVLAAAAEYRRQTHGSGEGFVALEAVVGHLSRHLLDLFQPYPTQRKAFRIALNLLKNKKNPLRGLGPALAFVPKAIKLYKAYCKLPTTYFALCPGLTLEGHETEGLTDWINRNLETLAGRMQPGGALPERPLTFGDLSQAGVRLRTLTTDLGSRNPVLVPFQDRTWFFRPEELADLLPAGIVQHLVAKGRPYSNDPSFHQLPRADDLPVLLGARASLSFPILLAALPLYRRDFSHRSSAEDRQRPRRCWLTDGGIATNFPIHLFDSPLPRRPTFGISLDQYSPTRQNPDPDVLQDRVYLPRGADEGILRPIHPELTSPLGFFAALFDTARNWQDSLQTVLPGYRERIARISLDHNEGGLNLEMEASTIARLTEYGALAGRQLSTFDLQEHKWRRLLVATATMEDAFETMHANLPGLESELQDHQGSYAPSKAERDELWQRWRALGMVMKTWTQDPLRDKWGKNGMPNPRTFVKFSPREQAGRD